LALEIIVVDSGSADGTVELIEQELRHPNIRFFSQPKGLYQSWNFAVSQCAGKWVYFSTAGDLITHEMLEYLLQTGEENNADVVISNPVFTDENGVKLSKQLEWPLHTIFSWVKVDRDKSISKELAQLFSIEAYPCAILGSSASNLYRQSHLACRPFPTEFGHGGDVIWCLRYAHETNYCLTRAIGSTFSLHHKSPEAITDYDLSLDLEVEKLRSVQKLTRLADSFIQEILPLKRQMKHMHKSRRLFWENKMAFLRPLFLYLCARYRYKKAYLTFRGKAILAEDASFLFSKKQ
jgi:glycosyltransferase involved in cell wall biosynthesis